MNLFIEGLQGSGKSTLARKLYEKFPNYKRFVEGDISPVELSWCAYVKEDDFQKIIEKYPDIEDEIKKWSILEDEYRIIAYLRILTEYTDFHREMEKFEIYNGNKSFVEFQNIIFKRYSNFYDDNNIFECSFFQNIIDTMILYYKMSYDEILNFYEKLWDKINNKDCFRLIYIDSENIEKNLLQICDERVDERGNKIWLKLMLDYLKNSPYGKEQNIQSFFDMIKYFEFRRNTEIKIINHIIKNNTIILKSKEYNENLDFIK